jgi:hypothetical protein
MCEFSDDSRNSLAAEWEAISLEWAQITVPYGGPDPDIPGGAPEWADLSTLNLVSRSENASADFTVAWHEVAIRARRLFTDRLVPWALRLVRSSKAAARLRECPDPVVSEIPLLYWEPGQAIVRLTGTNNSLVAGERIIFWAAAAGSPEFCHRSRDYGYLMWRWAVNLIEVGNGRCRMAHEPVHWIGDAFTSLSSTGVTPLLPEEMNVRVAPPAEVIAHTEGVEGTQSDLPPSESANAPHQTLGRDDPAMHTVRALAAMFGVRNVEILRKRLERWRHNHPPGDGWIEVSDPKPREPKYLYRLGVVSNIVEAAKASKSSGETSSERSAR